MGVLGTCELVYRRKHESSEKESLGYARVLSLRRGDSGWARVAFILTETGKTSGHTAGRQLEETQHRLDAHG